MAKDIIIAIVLTACGIETRAFFTSSLRLFVIAIVLTACGIETVPSRYRYLLHRIHCNSTYRLRY